jgi:hypothetical protein
MAQAQVMPGLTIETVSPTGQLSLHTYRKFLSQEDDIKMSFSPPPRTLKRKQAALNLFQAQSYDYAPNLQSPVSSAPSSPPPLSFSQSVISLPGDISTPISPASATKLFFQPISSVQSLVTRKMVSLGQRALFSCFIQPASLFFSLLTLSHVFASHSAVLNGYCLFSTLLSHNHQSFVSFLEKSKHTLHQSRHE